MLASGRFVPLSVDKDIHLHTSGSSVGSCSPKWPTLLNLSRAFQVTTLSLDALFSHTSGTFVVSRKLGGNALNLSCHFSVCDHFYGLVTMSRNMSRNYVCGAFNMKFQEQRQGILLQSLQCGLRKLRKLNRNHFVSHA